MSYNLDINQNTDYSRTFTVVDVKNVAVDLSTSTIQAQIRRNSTSSDYIQFNVYIIDPTHGKVTIMLPHSITVTMHGTYEYDIFLIDSSGFKYKISDGLVNIITTVTR